ncbi:WD repeat-containing protein jip5 [Ascosphaera acerosa]|nr:WD repeat-containing protein jip5 [Ascosphaera acerosa]
MGRRVLLRRAAQKFVAVGQSDGHVQLVQLGSNKVVATLRHDELEGVTGLGFDVEGRMVSGGGNVVKVWHALDAGAGGSDSDDGSDDSGDDSDGGVEKRAGRRPPPPSKRPAHKAASDSDDDSSDDDDEMFRSRKKQKGRKGKRRGGGHQVMRFEGLV